MLLLLNTGDTAQYVMGLATDNGIPRHGCTSGCPARPRVTGASLEFRTSVPVNVKIPHFTSFVEDPRQAPPCARRYRSGYRGERLLRAGRSSGRCPCSAAPALRSASPGVRSLLQAALHTAAFRPEFLGCSSPQFKDRSVQPLQPQDCPALPSLPWH